MLVTKSEHEQEESRGTEGARRATGVARETAEPNGEGPDPEVAAKSIRRRFTAAYKRRIVREADNCTKPGELGALARREGVYSSSLSVWRRRLDAGELGGSGPKRGSKAQPKDPRDRRIAELERETRRLERKLAVFPGNNHCTGLSVRHTVQELQDFFRAENDRHGLRFLWRRYDLFDRPVLNGASLDTETEEWQRQ